MESHFQTTLGWKVAIAAAAVVLPAAGFALLLVDPGIDIAWEDHPAHFWLVLAAAGITATLAHATGEAAERRGDLRLGLVSLTFLCSAGFLGLHALATPGVLLDDSSLGFVALAIPACIAATLYLVAAARYAVIGSGDPPVLVLAVAISFVLVGEAMLQTAFSRNWPIVEEHGGDVERLMGDALMATFNTRGDQPDHARRAAAAALAIRDATAAVAAENPGWPRFRVGVNSGDALVGVLGAAGGRSYTVIGDAVNSASRLESAAPVGEVAIGAVTLRALSGARTRALGAIKVKARREPLDAYVLESLPPDPG